jgi:F-type H+-transporting ATPase subunit b
MAEPHSNLPEVFATDEAQIEVADAHGETHVVEPELLGLEPYQWVSVAMLVLLLIAFLGAKVHKTIAGGLDNKIKAIRDNLDEAKQLRAEAEALREEYAAKIAGAEKDAEAMLENARREAEGIVAKAEQDTAAMIARRERMATDKIAAAERQAVAELKAKAADASTAAAAALIAAKHDAEADKALADEVIAGL